MRIIIVQSEIEEAIKAYVLNQIAVREGQEVTIDFKATRGDDGMTAEVNIGSVAGNEQKSPEKPVQSVQQTRATTTAAKTASASPAPAAAATKPIVSEPAASVASASTTTAQPETATATSETATSETAEAETVNQKEEGEVSGFPAKTPEYDAGREEAIAAQEAEAAKVVPVSKPSFLNAQSAAAPADAVPASGKSLFANLTKPVNPKPPAEG